MKTSVGVLEIPAAFSTKGTHGNEEGLGLFEEIWENATPEERNELMRFYVYKVIFTPTEVKMALYTRPIFAEQVASITGNHDRLGAVEGIKWLLRQDSNLQPFG